MDGISQYSSLGIKIFNFRSHESPYYILLEKDLWELASSNVWESAVDPLSKQLYHSNFIFPDKISTCKRHIIHVQFSRSGTWLTFLYRVKCEYDKFKVKTYQFVMDTSGNNLWRVPRVIGSHHDFGWDEIFVNDGIGMWLVNVKSHHVIKLRSSSQMLPTGGHGTFAYGDFGSQNREIILTDQRFRKVKWQKKSLVDLQELWVYIPKLDHKILVYRAYQDKEENFKQARTDMHPRWSIDGKKAFFDFYSESAGKQLFMINIRPAVQVAQAIIRAKEKVHIIYGRGGAQRLDLFFTKKQDATEWKIMIFASIEQVVEPLLSHITKNAWKNVQVYQFQPRFKFPHTKDIVELGSDSMEALFISEVDKSSYCSLDFVEAVNLDAQFFCREAVLSRINKIIIKENTKIAKNFKIFRKVFETNGIDYELV